MKDCEEIRDWYQEQRQRKEKSRMDYCKRQIEALGYPVTVYPNAKKLTFELNGNTITVFPYKGWCTGKGIKDGRGIQSLLNQLHRERRQRRKGFATKMLQLCEGIVKAEGHPGAYLWAVEGSWCVEWYKRKGYKSTGETLLRPGETVTNIWMYKEL